MRSRRLAVPWMKVELRIENMAEKEYSDDLDDWETLDENGELDKQIDALKIQKTDSTGEQAAQMSSEPCFPLEFGRVKILQNNDQRTQYKPMIKLLKRDPAQEPAANAASMGDRKPSYKSLQQREQEYAEARKRILGSATEENGTSEGSTESSAPASQENSPKPNHRMISNEKPIVRAPNGPDLKSKGFKNRNKPNNTTSS